MKFISMTHEGKSPWQIVLRGAAIPGMIVGACALTAAVYALFDGSNVLSTTKIGIGLGLFFSLFGVLEIVLGIISFGSENTKTNALLILGYLLVWAACLCIIFF